MDDSALCQFSIAVASKMMTLIRSGSMSWMVRPRSGTNMTKRMKVGCLLELRNNTTKMVVKVEDIVVAAPHTDALANLVGDIVKLGYEPSTVAHGAKSIPDAVNWIRELVTLAPTHELVAFRISTDEDGGDNDAKEQADGETALPTADVRELIRRSSDPVDMADPEYRRKYQSLVQSSKKYGGDVLQYDVFSSLAGDIFKTPLVNDSLLTLLTTVIRLTFRAIPREIDYIVSHERSSQLTMGSMRKQMVEKLVLLRAKSESIQFLQGVMDHFDALLPQHGFPSYRLDADAFASDLLSAANHTELDRNESAKAVVHSNAEGATPVGSTVAGVQPDVVGGNDAGDVEPSGPSVEDESAQQVVSAGEGDGGLEMADDGLAVPDGGEAAADAAIDADGGGVLGKAVQSRFSVFDGTIRFADADSSDDEVSTVELTRASTDLAKSMVYVAIDSLVHTQVCNKLKFDTDYKALCSVPVGELVIPYRGVLRPTSSSRFQVPCCGNVLDGTTRASEFPSPWKLPAHPDGNMHVKYVDAPIVATNFNFSSTTASFLKGFQIPVLTNKDAIAAGDAIVRCSSTSRV